MEDLAFYLVAIGALIACIGFTVLALLIYSGLFENVTIGAGPPPIGEVFIAYRFARGPYKEAGQIFTEACHIAPDNKSLGIYYDDPKHVASDITRYIVGSVLAYGKDEPNPDTKRKFEEKGYKFMRLPTVTNVVKTSFPHISSLSIFIAVFKVYPAMGAYVQEHKLCAYPHLEIYDGKTIHFMAPLARQEEFYAAELKKLGSEGEVIMEPTDKKYLKQFSQFTFNFIPPEDIPTKPDLLTNEAEAVAHDDLADEANGGDSEASTGSSFEELKMDGDGDNVRKRDIKADSPDSTTL